MIKKLFFGLFTAVLFVSCANSEPVTQVETSEEMVIIDVRTPSEFSEGHVQGAINLDLEGGTFEAELPNLDPQQTYAVYCRSGRRSEIAAQMMQAKGFVNLTDYGTMENAANNLGLAIVTD